MSAPIRHPKGQTTVARGQTTVDYILVLAVVLLIGLLALGLSGGWPDFALNAKNRQAEVFWQDQTRPITIPEAHYDMSDKTLFFAMQTQVDEPLVLTKLFLGEKQMALSTYSGATLMCDAASCWGAGCTCTYPLNPRRRELAITEDMSAAGIDPGCRQTGTFSRLPLQLVYYRPSEPGRMLSQNATVDLVFDCQP
jgi:hypothetical protein